MAARIYKPAKNAMQSGRGRTENWVLEFEPERAKTVEPLMGYTSSTDMLQQVKLSFETRDQAIAYATRNGLAYRVVEPKERTAKRMSYSDNFKSSKAEVWTH
ncbi:ETC complex I subunit [Oryzibacter oryziterrae]|uniref:ETC complex I subunit n=1 Tax=Oryzibacter oryziterrae TaxID=2766474 RepID=UPI001F4371F4|nr:ETC complex I subunit [Oryzibacter oryziterrae]